MRAIGPTLVEGSNTSQLRANAMNITVPIMESPIPQKRNITPHPGSWRFANGLPPSEALGVLQNAPGTQPMRLSQTYPKLLYKYI